MATLDELGQQRGTDKSSKRHNFLVTYELFLNSLSTQAKSVLELGVYQGASLAMWKEYFPQAKIVGVDINKQAESFADTRTVIEIGDCGNMAFLEEVADRHGPFDFIIDDASHRWGHQQTAFKALFSRLIPGGVYIIEDLHTSYVQKYGEASLYPTTEWLKLGVDLLVRNALPSEVPKQRLLDQPYFHDPAQWRRVDSVTFLRESCIIRAVK